MSKFYSKPIEVDAWRVDFKGADAPPKWVFEAGEQQAGTPGALSEVGDQVFLTEEHRGTIEVKDGDWLVRTGAGAIMLLTDDEFREIYQPKEDVVEAGELRASDRVSRDVMKVNGDSDTLTKAPPTQEADPRWDAHWRKDEAFRIERARLAITEAELELERAMLCAEQNAAHQGQKTAGSMLGRIG